MAGVPGVVFDVDGTLLETNYLHTSRGRAPCVSTGTTM